MAVPALTLQKKTPLDFSGWAFNTIFILECRSGGKRLYNQAGCASNTYAKHPVEKIYLTDQFGTDVTYLTRKLGAYVLYF
ncbi:MAG: hypothetical protein GY869_00655, partial [Planctomycetes bacterium]|nr:hypothetical protein [Planctomycetota bacterium]